MDQKEFADIKAENPESRIGKRTYEYQQARDYLANVLNTGDEKNEKSARMNYLVQKAFSYESFNKKDYDFILGMETKDLSSFVSSIKNILFKYINKVYYISEYMEDAPFDYEVDPIFTGNKILRFISQTRNDVFSKTYRINTNHTHVNGGDSRNDEMKTIYPNREEMVEKNEAEIKEKHEKLKQSRKDSIKDEKRKDAFEKIYGNEKAVIEDLKDNFVNIEENIEMFGKKGKKVTLELPEVGDFKGFKFESFISDEPMNAKKLKMSPKLERQLYSMKEIGNLLLAIKEYMKQHDVELDGRDYYDYENRLKEERDSDAGSCLSSILDLDNNYWLKNTILLGHENGRTIKFKPHVVFSCHEDRCGFSNSKHALEFDDIGEILMNRLDGTTLGCCEGIDDAMILAKLS